METYNIKLDAFEGPMDLLMHLIEKNKIDIYDIPIAKLTSQYLAYLDKMREFDMEVASSFLVMAATLLQIKSCMMLPRDKNVAVEDEEDPRFELVQRILEYRKFKDISGILGDMADMQDKYIAREPLTLPTKHLPPGNLNLKELVIALVNVMAVKTDLSIPKVLVEPEQYNIKQKMTDIMKLLDQSGGKLLFTEAFEIGSRSEIVVTFLSLLELIKIQAVVVTQQRDFADIYISVCEQKGQNHGGD